MTYRNYNSLQEISNKILDRTESIYNKVNREIEGNYDFERFAKSYRRSKAKVIIEGNDISVCSNDCYDDYLCFCTNPSIYPDLPIESLWDDKVLDAYIERYKEHEKDREEDHKKAEYERYLELKQRYESMDISPKD